MAIAPLVTSDMTVAAICRFFRSPPLPVSTLYSFAAAPGLIAGGESWAWLHYTGNSTTKRIDDGLEFTAYHVPAVRASIRSARCSAQP